MANGYAVLKELNYHSYIYSPNNPLAQVFGEPVWDADYLGDAVNRVILKGEPPFEYCYLVDARNATVDLERKDVYHMIDCSIPLWPAHWRIWTSIYPGRFQCPAWPAPRAPRAGRSKHVFYVPSRTVPAKKYARGA